MTRAVGIAHAAYVVLVMAFLLAPVLVIVLFSFNAGSGLSFPIESLSLRWYETAWNDDNLRQALENSLVVGASMLVLVCLLGLPAAWAIGRSRFRGRRLLLVTLLAPLGLPGLFVGVALLSYFVRIGIEPSVRTVAIAHVLYTLGFFVLVASSRFAALDRQLDEAARTLGATRIGSLRMVTWPLVRPAVLSALALCFALSLDEFVITFFVIGPENTLPILIFSKVRTTVTPEINAIATVLLVASWAIVALAVAIAYGRQRLPGASR